MLSYHNTEQNLFAEEQIGNEVVSIAEIFCQRREENLVKLLQITRTRGIGYITFCKLLDKFASENEHIFDAMLDYLEYKLIQKNKIKDFYSKDSALKEVELTYTENANFLTIFDEGYCQKLANIYDPPVIITYKTQNSAVIRNSLLDLNSTTFTKNVAMVGSRNCSANSANFTYSVSAELANYGSCIISGLAKGIDKAAHSGAISDIANNGETCPTIGVIATGIDVIYPRENVKLYNEMLEKGGCIFTEYPFNAAPKGENFPRRNRIISGLSDVVIIVEAGQKSGSLITARYAAEQGKEVFCVPNFPFDAKAKGTNKLIKNGANIFTEISDIYEFFDSEESKLIPQNKMLVRDIDGSSYEADSYFSEDELDNLLFGGGEHNRRNNIENFTENAQKELGGEKMAFHSLDEPQNINIREAIITELSYNPADIDLAYHTIMGRICPDKNNFKNYLKLLEEEIAEMEIEGLVARHRGNKISLVQAR